MRTSNTSLFVATAAAWLLCSGFREAPVAEPPATAYTKSVTELPGAAGFVDSTSGGTSAMRIDLRLTELAWSAASLFGKVLSWEFTTEVPDAVARWSGAVLNKTVELITAVARWPLGEGPTAVFGRGTTAIEAASQQTGSPLAARRRNDRILDGRMPSLARSMGSSLDPAMGLDDILRDADAGLQAGMVLEKPLSGGREDDPIEFRLLIPGL